MASRSLVLCENRLFSMSRGATRRDRMKMRGKKAIYPPARPRGNINNKRAIYSRAVRIGKKSFMFLSR